MHGIHRGAGTPSSFLKDMKPWLFANAIICVFSVLFAFATMFDFAFQPYYNDYAIYHYTAKELVEGGGFTSIYDQAFMFGEYHVLWFRYFPAELVLFYPLVRVGLEGGYAIFSAVSFGCNLLTTWFIFRIGKDVAAGGWGSLRKYALLFLITEFNFTTYCAGQISAIVGACLAAAAYFHLSNRTLAASACLGLSAFFKPVSFFAIIFYALASGGIKPLLKRAVATIIPLVPNIAIFCFDTSLALRFVDMNFVDSNRTAGFQNTVSLSNALGIVGIPTSATMIAGVAAGMLAWVFLRNRVRDKGLFSIVFGMAVYFVVAGDIWDTQVLYLYPLIAIAFSQASPSLERKSFKLYAAYPIACCLFALSYLRVEWLSALVVSTLACMTTAICVLVAKASMSKPSH